MPCLFTWHHGKIERKISQDVAFLLWQLCGPPMMFIFAFLLENVNLNQSGLSLGAISQHPPPHMYTAWDHAAVITLRKETFCLLEVKWRKKCNSSPEKQQRTLWRLLKETGKQLSIPTGKWVLYWQILKGCSKTTMKHQTTVFKCRWGQRSWFLKKCPLDWWKQSWTVWP